MNSKLFSLFSVTSLTGAVILSAAACSDATTTSFTDDAGATSSSGSSGKKKGSSSSSSSSSSSGESSSSSSGGDDTTSSSGGSSSGGSSSGGSSSGGSSSGGSSSGGSSSGGSSSGASGSSSGSVIVDAGQDAKPPPNSCLDTTPINATLYPYAKAVKSAGACTQTELNALSGYLDNLQTDLVMADWKATVSTKCATCVFTDTGATSWGPIITKAGAFEDLNRGGCIEIKSGNQACGKAYQQVTNCRLDACYSMCQTDQELDDCLSDGGAIFGAGGPCQAAYDNVITACGADLGDYENACMGTNYTFEGPVKAQCITGN
jgi:hypothetical protein